MHGIAECCTKLKSLDLSHSKIVASNDVLALLRGCSLLNSLNLEACVNVASFVLTAMKRRRFKYLNIKNSGILIDEKTLVVINELDCSELVK